MDKKRVQAVARLLILVSVLGNSLGYGSVFAASLNKDGLDSSQAAAQNIDPTKLQFNLVVSGLNQPTVIANAGDGSNRLFVAERSGVIRIFSNGSLNGTPFLDMHTVVNSTSSERGLVALAFHPQYATNGYFYTVHTNAAGSLVLSRFKVSANNANLADLNSRTELLVIPHPTYANHNGGTLAFGVDGYLYWSTGDGGGAGDPFNNAQNLTSLLGKILRIDVNSGSPYSIPSTNPFYNNPNASIRKEIWAYGLRNPWRITFDRLTHDMYIADVGQGNREEVNYQPASSSGGENYGWNVMEGTACYNPSTGCNKSGKVLPVAEYDHSLGCSITGGYVYRGSNFPSLYGHYFYGDYCSGRVFGLYNNLPAGWIMDGQLADTSYNISTFGEDEHGELYLADLAEGKIYNIAYQETYLISGNTGVGGTTLSYTDGTLKTVTSQANGNYSLIVSYNWIGTVTPSHSCYNFSPGSRSYSNVKANQTGQNYTPTFNGSSACAKSVGKYDDTDAGWLYLGSWTHHSGPFAFYNKTDSYSAVTGDTASFPFSGKQFILTYTMNTVRGNMEIYVDGNKQATINAYGTQTFQKTYTSPMYTSGTHVVEVRNGGGGYVDVDAIQILETTPLGPGTYDDTNPSCVYTGTWTHYTGPFAFYNNTDSYTGTTGDQVSCPFTGTQFILTYTMNSVRGNMEIYVDGKKIDTINANGPQTFQKTYKSPSYPDGIHLLQVRNGGGGGGYIDMDAIEILATAAPGKGKYNNTNPNWEYIGSWTHYGGPYPPMYPFYNNDDSYSGAAGDTASFTFTGNQFILTYTKNTLRGNMELYVDGSPIATINAYGPQRFQVLYVSPVFTNGTHVVQVRNGGGGGGYIDVDAIEIRADPVPSVGMYDDSDANWIFSPNWTHFQGDHPFYNKTDSYTGFTGETAYFTFSGTQFILTYTRNTVRGNMEVYVDGSLLTTINAYGPQTYRVEYISPVYPSGIHIVQVRNAGGGYIDVDAIQVLNTTPAGLGKYDDTDANWVYNGSWTHYTGPYDFYNNTDSYSGVTGEKAYFTFSGTQFILTYTMNTVRGNMEIFVDGSWLVTINAYGPQTFQKTFASPGYSNGTHMVQIRNAGGGLGYIDVDAIEIK